MIAAGADTLSREKPFVCQTTPHFGSTLRKASYSVQGYLTTNFPKCKSPKFDIFLPEGDDGQKEGASLVKMTQTVAKIRRFPLAFCANSLYNEDIFVREG